VLVNLAGADEHYESDYDYLLLDRDLRAPRFQVVSPARWQAV